jgi:PTH2 family peptidyl-tRNA hydrolase
LDPSEFNFKLVIAVRTDLGMSRGKIAVQVGHASVMASENVRTMRRSWWKTWIEEGQCKVAVKVKSKEELFELKQKANRLGLSTTVVQDRGLTEVAPGTVTCVGIGPGPAELVDRVTGSLRLL